MSPSRKMQAHFLAATLAGLVLRLFFLWRFPFVAPDSSIYEELARNWLDYRVYGLFVTQNVTPVDIRVPGYPAFLAAIYAVFHSSQLAVRSVQAVVDLATCGLTAVLAARLAPPEGRKRVAVGAMWLAALCPFTANYTAALLTETLATFLTTLAIVLLLDAWAGEEDARGDEAQPGRTWIGWFLAGIVVGLGALVRPETPLVLGAFGLVLLVRWRRRQDWRRLMRFGALSAAGLFFALLPWAARNWYALDRVQFLAPRYAELPGEFVPRGFYAWTRTWLVRFGDVYLTIWKLGDEPISVDSLPTAAFDPPNERERVRNLLETYNVRHKLTPALDEEFGELASERTRHHPLHTYLWIPLGRAATLWFTPRIELLPYSGQLWPPGEKWEEDRADFVVTVIFGLLGFVYVALALVGAWCFRREPAVHLLMAFLLVRTVFLTQIETPEPRYTLVCFPVVLVLATLRWAKPQPTPRQAQRIGEA